MVCLGSRRTELGSRVPPALQRHSRGQEWRREQNVVSLNIAELRDNGLFGVEENSGGQ